MAKSNTTKELNESLLTILSQMGARIRQARLRRSISQSVMADSADCTMVTVGKIEKGDPSVSLGTYAKVLECLQLEGDFNLIAKDDQVGYQKLDAQLPRRVRSKGQTTHHDKKTE